MATVSLRKATAADVAFLQEMLLVAADWRFERPRRTVADVLDDASVAHYVAGWPRPGDVGIVAEGAEPVGAAWWRFFPSDDPGYGFVDDSVPEVSVGVRHGFRRQGIGTMLLLALIAHARTAGLRALSLSVERDNNAAVLYEELGFEVVAAEDGAFTMLLALRS